MAVTTKLSLAVSAICTRARPERPYCFSQGRIANCINATRAVLGFGPAVFCICNDSLAYLAYNVPFACVR